MIIKFKLGNLDNVIKQVQEYEQSLTAKNEKLTKILSDNAEDRARSGYAAAQYDGDKSITVRAGWEERNKYVCKRHIKAKGEAVTFIEFGTGVTYNELHPLAPKFGFVRGGYGKGKGSQRTWGYYGKKGTNGVYVKGRTNLNGDNLVLTHGNPASRSMYDASQGIRKELVQTAREVYSTK